MARKTLGLTSAPESLTECELNLLRPWVREHFPFLTKRQFQDEWEKCRDWHLSRGIQRCCWVATTRNWLRMGAKFSSQGFSPRHNHELERLDNVLPLLRGTASGHKS